MKKLLITGIIVLIASVSMNAQDISKNALGLRLGNNDGFGGEISYQARLSTNTVSYTHLTLPTIYSV